MDEELMAALEADGEKLRQLTGRDHGPWFDPEPTDEGDVWDDDSVPVNIWGEVKEGSEYEDA
jgi:hypothetical protein